MTCTNGNDVNSVVASAADIKPNRMYLEPSDIRGSSLEALGHPESINLDASTPNCCSGGALNHYILNPDISKWYSPTRGAAWTALSLSRRRFPCRNALERALPNLLVECKFQCDIAF